LFSSEIFPRNIPKKKSIISARDIEIKKAVSKFKRPRVVKKIGIIGINANNIGEIAATKAE